MADIAWVVLLALLLDAWLGEVKSYHPLVGFGAMANGLERLLNRPWKYFPRLAGVLALLIGLWPVYGLWWLLVTMEINSIWLDAVILYIAIGRKSLMEHGEQVAIALQQGSLDNARKKLARMVSRDTAHLSEKEIIKATIESLAENSNDAIYGAIFWYMVAGAPGVVLYRLGNTLDAMWGYKNKRYKNFGWAAARLDDVLNYIPARLAVISFALIGRLQGGSFFKNIQQSFGQGKACSSFNGGPVMAAVANVLNIRLGGEALYNGVNISKPLLGSGTAAGLADLQRAMGLVNRVCILWLMVLGSGAIVETWWPLIISSQ